jgi:NAD(P)-dependent dehydrogenase (short-subunit alcohol dehydrogenase family)
VDRAYLEGLFGLAGRAVLVTGARQGIGRTLALAYARAGASVAVTSRDPGSLAGVAGELAALGAEHCELGLDVRSEDEVVAAVDAAYSRLGGLDVVVNNAGVAARKPALEHSAVDWDTVVGTNLRGTFLVSREAARLMSGGGRIINLSSTFATVPHPDRAAYAASKAGIDQLTRVLALEWAPRGITVNAIAPTTIETETRRGVLGPEAREARIRSIPLGRLGLPEDLVGTALMLASDAGRFVTGVTILVDGGYSLGSAER